MSTPTPAGRSNKVAVTAIGLLTVLLGGFYATMGGDFTLAGTKAFKQLEDDPAGGLGFLLQFIASFVALIGVAFLLQGVLGLLAGSGMLWRRPWGRILTFILAVLAILWGLASLGFYDQGATYVVAGAAQLLYGVLALVILIKHGAEFSRPGV